LAEQSKVEKIAYESASTVENTVVYAAFECPNYTLEVNAPAEFDNYSSLLS
jgi:hypothetical protein